MMKNSYEIIDVDETNKAGYCVCLEEWSDEIQEAGNHKACWYDKMKKKGLGIKMVKDTDGTISGLIQYIPAEYAPLTGKDFYYIYCVWVHGHKKGIGNRKGSGMGTELLEAAEADIRELGGTGAAAWGISMPFWMKASWYKKHGYKVVQKDGMRRLLWKPFKEGIEPPRWYENIKSPEISDNSRVKITSLMNGICPVMNLAHERAKAVAAEFEDSVDFQIVRTDEPGMLKEWGISDCLFINDKKIELGPPLSKDKIRKMIRRQMKKLWLN
jgi:hypothetical protein